MGKIEREIKILNVDVKKVKDKLRQEGINQKWAYIQDVYTFDFSTGKTHKRHSGGGFYMKRNCMSIERF